LEKNKPDFSSQIKARCFNDSVVIWIHPTAFELDSIENHLQKEEFETFEQDAGIYNTDAQSFLLEKVNMKYFIADSIRFYRFILNGDTLKLDTWRDSPWRIVLFDSNNKPLLTSPINIERDFVEYFK